MIVRKLWVLPFLLLPCLAFAEKLEPSNQAKVYTGSNGEEITLLEVNNSTKILAKFEGVGGEWEGKIQLWILDSQDGEHKEAYYERKQGSKKSRYVTLALQNGSWSAYPPERPNGISLIYSKKASEAVKANDVIKRYSSQKDSENEKNDAAR